MIRGYGVIRRSARCVGNAALRAVRDIQVGSLQQEPHITDRMLGRMTEAIDGLEVNGISWSALTLTDHGPRTQEREYGADFMGVLTINLPEFYVQKGFLAQAKFVRQWQSFDRNERNNLRNQCQRMLQLSADSFVFLYSSEGIWVVPAISVVGADGDPVNLYSRAVTRFFEMHFESFIGDRLISSPTSDTLKQLREQYNVRTAISLQAKHLESPRGRTTRRA